MSGRKEFGKGWIWKELWHVESDQNIFYEYLRFKNILKTNLYQPFFYSHHGPLPWTFLSSDIECFFYSKQRRSHGFKYHQVTWPSSGMLTELLCIALVQVDIVTECSDCNSFDRFKRSCFTGFFLNFWLQNLSLVGCEGKWGGVRGVGGEEWSVERTKLHCMMYEILKENINKTCSTIMTQVTISLCLLKWFIVIHKLYIIMGFIMTSYAYL